MTTLGLNGTATADPSAGHSQKKTAPVGVSADRGDGTRELSPAYFDKPRPLDRQASKAALRKARANPRSTAAAVGQQKIWLALDDRDGSIYLKRYELRGIGDHIQVWVANDRAFPIGDCRNDLGLTEITNKEVKSFIKEFDGNILPTESKSFSVAPNRNGKGGKVLAEELGLPKTYWKVTKKRADDTVVLVDNVRDTNFSDPNSADGKTRIGGFFASQFNDLVDRNVMTIDAFDWVHETGANPPDDSKKRAYKACGVELGATPGRLGRPDPHSYEGTFAHEYQHLLEHYQDPDEVSWVNEGLSDYAQTLTGYVNPAISPVKKTADSHIACFQGYLEQSFGGPENSLTLWGDQGDPEILCDYGAAYSFMQYLFDRYGEGFLSALHKQNRNGIPGLQKVLNTREGGVGALKLMHRWSAMMALDGILDRNGGRLVGARAKRYRSATLKSRIHWSNPQSFDTDGAPANGSDYVRLRDAAGHYLSASQVGSVDFAGGSTLPGEPVEWEVDSSPPNATSVDTTCGTTTDGAAPTALYSGCGDGLDRSLVRQVAVPAGSPELSFDTLYDTEEAWDFGFVQVSTDNGASWTSLATQDTTSAHDPQASAAIAAQMPGFTGDSGSWKTETADLSAYAGQNVLLGFRYMSDEAVAEAGMWVRNIAVDSAALPSDSLTGWQTISQAHPAAVPGWTVQLVSYGTKAQRAHWHFLGINGSFDGALSGSALRQAIGSRASVVAAIVSYDDPSELLTKEAPYTLTVNGVTQPGGGAN